MMKIKVITQEKKHEKCVFCKVQTNIPIELDVRFRLHYVEGCGQLCPECYERVFKNNKN